MNIVNITLSFSDTIRQSALEWIKQEYIPLLQACTLVESVGLYAIEAQQDADECFALQMRFADNDNYQTFADKYENDFSLALYAKFTNQFGMFKTVLTSI